MIKYLYFCYKLCC